jgi:hypothetical protein
MEGETFLKKNKNNIAFSVCIGILFILILTIFIIYFTRKKRINEVLYVESPDVNTLLTQQLGVFKDLYTFNTSYYNFDNDKNYQGYFRVITKSYSNSINPVPSIKFKVLDDAGRDITRETTQDGQMFVVDFYSRNSTNTLKLQISNQETKLGIKNINVEIEGKYTLY